MTPETDWQARRDAGIESSAEHAEQDVPGWGGLALSAVALWASYAHKGPCHMDTIRAWCYGVHGLSKPPDDRAWGAVTRAAVRKGIIAPTGQYAPAPSSNGSVKPLYRGCV